MQFFQAETNLDSAVKFSSYFSQKNKSEFTCHEERTFSNIFKLCVIFIYIFIEPLLFITTTEFEVTHIFLV